MIESTAKVKNTMPTTKPNDLAPEAVPLENSAKAL
jgi:hypothetical protein